MMILNNQELEKSSVVANSFMNRDRKGFGVNSYEKEIKMNPLVFIKNRIMKNYEIRWLDICCGKGLALIQIAEALKIENADRIFLTGIDLAGEFRPIPCGVNNLKLIESPISEFTSQVPYDLITCVHGMHYIGDKLGMIIKYVKMLKLDGVFLCNIDTNDIFDEKGKKLGRKINSLLRKQGVQYSLPKKLLKCKGLTELVLPVEYIGADDRYGRNYTGQSTVFSYYSLTKKLKYWVKA